MATREDCICAPLDPEPDCPYHGNRDVVIDFDRDPILEDGKLKVRLKATDQHLAKRDE